MVSIDYFWFNNAHQVWGEDCEGGQQEVERENEWGLEEVAAIGACDV